METLYDEPCHTGNLGKEPADSFLKDQHPHEKFDLVMANPPFNMKEWGQPVLQNDKRWEYGQPPANKSILLFYDFYPNKK